MAHIVFFEKPGCGGNARQRALLQAAGHTLQRRSLLAEPWTADSLMAWLAPLPVAQWFNRAAPRVRDGLVQPEALTADEALPLLLAEPLLIRRPLMQRDDGQRLVGFEVAEVQRFVGLAPATDGASAATAPGKLEGCAATAPQAPRCQAD